MLPSIVNPCHQHWFFLLPFDYHCDSAAHNQGDQDDSAAPAATIATAQSPVTPKAKRRTQQQWEEKQEKWQNKAKKVKDKYPRLVVKKAFALHKLANLPGRDAPKEGVVDLEDVDVSNTRAKRRFSMRTSMDTENKQWKIAMTEVH
ncbi:MAG: hypothetical protein Q9170_001265 [Blastenia crenularia]